jgi:D-beta-D-heptose 7-phosphate kinase/D-beta-D-heptose 1-phosphate adenosyltransferase
MLRSGGKKLVFTNGCFDLIHRGHIEYLVRAKALGDYLLVGVNTDASVRRIKGAKRPIVCEDDRAYIIANLAPVDFVCLFDEDTPLRLIKEIVPDILVKGSDWPLEEIVGKEVVEAAGGRVATIGYIPDNSTTGLVETIIRRFGNTS